MNMVTNITNRLPNSKDGVVAFLAQKGISIEDPDIRAKILKVFGLPTNLTRDRVLDELLAKLRKGSFPSFYRTGAGSTEVIVTEYVRTEKPRIMLIETYALTSFLGDYGAGKTVQTFSLLPNEKTKISIKTWKTSEVTSKQASSILDSFTKETSDNFEKGVQSESSNKENTLRSQEWHAEASASASGGMGCWGAEASVSGGVSGSTNSARESFSKNVSNATEKHVSSASSKRNVEVNTSFEAKTTVGEEQSIVRELENVNAGRVLNFVFRQLHQEYITYLCLVDVRLAFTDGRGPTSKDNYREFGLNEIEKLLEMYIKPNGRDASRKLIIDELNSIFDYNGRKHSIIECVYIQSDSSTAVTVDVAKYHEDPEVRKKSYLRIKRDRFYQNENPNPTTNQKNYEKHSVDGIILSKNTYILPTDSVIVESLLGQAEALDRYSLDSRTGVIEMKNAEVQKMRLANEIVKNKDEEMANLFSKVFPPPPQPRSESSP